MLKHERVLAALERREPDRVPTMDMMVEVENIYEILGKKPSAPSWIFAGGAASRVFDTLVAKGHPRFIVDKPMEEYILDRTEAAVRMGHDSAWVLHTPTWVYRDSKTIVDFYGRLFEVLVDDRGNILSPMYRGGVIEDMSGWRGWEKKNLLRLPQVMYRVYSKLSARYGDDIFIFGSFPGGLFEVTWQAMGFERFAVAARRDRLFLETVIGFHADLYCLILEALSAAGIPGLVYPDDLAYRSGPMLAPRMLEELFGDSYRRITSTAHRLGMPVVIHSCGDVHPLLGWFADCGFDGVHALEPTAGIELAEAKELVGERLCLIGNIDITHILVDASREEVFEAVRCAIRDAGAGGGYMVAPTNSHPGMSVRNLRWMQEAVREYGRYPLDV